MSRVARAQKGWGYSDEEVAAASPEELAHILVDGDDLARVQVMMRAAAATKSLKEKMVRRSKALRRDLAWR